MLAKSQAEVKAIWKPLQRLPQASRGEEGMQAQDVSDTSIAEDAQQQEPEKADTIGSQRDQ